MSLYANKGILSRTDDDKTQTKTQITMCNNNLCSEHPFPWEYYLEEQSVEIAVNRKKLTLLFHSVRDFNGKNIARFQNREIAILFSRAPQLLNLAKNLLDEIKSINDLSENTYPSDTQASFTDEYDQIIGELNNE